MKLNNQALLRWAITIIGFVIFIWLAIHGAGKAVFGAEIFTPTCTPITFRGKIASVSQNFKENLIKVEWELTSTTPRRIILVFSKLEVWAPAFYGERAKSISRITVLNALVPLGPPDLFLPGK